MRLVVQRLFAIAVFHAKVFNLRRQIVKTFSAQKIVVGGMAKPALQPDKFMQIGMRFAGGEIEVFTAAFGIESEFDGDGFKQGGFARTILANKKGDGGMKLEPFQMPNGRDTKWIFVKAFHQFT